jgi:hypothetical protein
MIFFFFFGCPYEFVKCYLERKYEDDDSLEELEEAMESRKIEEKELVTDENEKCTVSKILICIILCILGLLCQPLYLMFYLLYVMMECYRRLGCWIFFAYY